MILQTEHIRLGKARQEDYFAMWKNVWSHPETARYMHWQTTGNEEDAKARMERTILFQQTHNAYLVYDNKSGEAIGFAGIELVETDRLPDGMDSCRLCEETGIALGPAFVGKGYGSEILRLLLDYAREEYGAEGFIYSSREKNTASIALAKKFHFALVDTQQKVDSRNGEEYRMNRYFLAL